MGRILAIDYGTKRIGLAETDDLQLIASGIGTIHSSELKSFIHDYIAKYQLETIVIGLPKRLNNEATQATKLANDTYNAHFQPSKLFRLTNALRPKWLLQPCLKVV